MTNMTLLLQTILYWATHDQIVRCPVTGLASPGCFPPGTRVRLEYIMWSDVWDEFCWAILNGWTPLLGFNRRSGPLPQFVR